MRQIVSLGACVRAIAAVLAIGMLASCAKKQYVRGSEKKNLDKQAMSTKLDQRDINTLYDKTIKALLDSSIVNQWKRKSRESEPPVVAIFPMRNETSEHIGPQLDTLLSKFQTDLVNKTPVSVISKSAQSQLMNEIKQQQSDAYNPDRLASYGEQLGAQYYVTGKVRDVAERVQGERRVQYFMFVQVLDVSTAAIKFQHEAQITKGFVK